MATVFDLVGALLIAIGTAFLLFGGLGLVRMPDIFNRIQAGTKTTTLGTLLTLVGTGFLRPEWGWKLILIALFLMFTNPLSSQVLARAAQRRGVEKSATTTVDRFAEDHGERK